MNHEPEVGPWRSGARCCGLRMGECGNTPGHCDCGQMCVDYGKLGNVAWGDSVPSSDKPGGTRTGIQDFSKPAQTAQGNTEDASAKLHDLEEEVGRLKSYKSSREESWQLAPLAGWVVAVGLCVVLMGRSPKAVPVPAQMNQFNLDGGFEEQVPQLVYKTSEDIL